MTLAASVALASGTLACYVAVLSALLARAPGWREQRYFSLVAFAVAGYALLNLPTTAPLLGDDRTVLLCSRLQIALAAMHTFAWFRYSTAIAGRPAPTRADRLVVPVLLAIAVIGTLTPAFMPGPIRSHPYQPLSALYRTAEFSAAGEVAYAVTLGLLAGPVVRFVRAWRRGISGAGVQAAALGLLMAMGVNDTLVASGVYDAPYLVDVAFLLPVASVGYALTSRFVESARAYDALQRDLLRQVADRTAELGRAQEALHKAEKLAALGQFAAGVAHEVNNPAAVVNANLQYLMEQERDGLSPSGVEAVEESRTAMQRVAVIVRQLLDAGRLAASPEARASVAVRPLGDAAFAVARARFGKRVRLTNQVPEDACVLAGEGIVAQVLVNLVVNAVQAIPDHRSDGQVEIRARREGERLAVVVADNGAGMPPEVLRRVFEPFFTTKPFGSGSGLGLAVSRGLVASLGGDLRLSSAPGAGTEAIVELAAAAPAPRAAPRKDAARAANARLKLLVVDDEAPVRSSLRRVLEPRYAVDVAAGVDDGLARLDEGGFDLVLCDVMMPAGGGERLYQTLRSRTPALARRIVFLTGGAVTDAARQFLRAQPQPVLEKPLDVEQLERVAERVRAAGDACARA